MSRLLIISASLYLLAAACLADEPRGIRPGGCRRPELERETRLLELERFPKIYESGFRRSRAVLTESFESRKCERLDCSGGIPVSLEVRPSSCPYVSEVVVIVGESSNFTVRVAYSSKGTADEFYFHGIEPGDYVLGVDRRFWVGDHAVVTLMYDDSVAGMYLVDLGVIAIVE